MKTPIFYKTLSMLLTAALLLNLGFTPVFANDIPSGASEVSDEGQLRPD